VTRDGPISSSVALSLSFFSSFLFWHQDRTTPSRHHHPYLLQPSVSPHNHPIWSCMGGDLLESLGELEPPTFSLSFVGKIWPFQWATRSSPTVDVWWASGLGISSSSSFYQLPYSWGRLFKTLLFEEPLPHPNRMANSI
jgi:hypothetical protein